jgi:hypothetical protein
MDSGMPYSTSNIWLMLRINTRLGDGVTARRISYLQEAIGSPRRPILFAAIRNRVIKAIYELSRQMADELQEEMDEILKQVGNDIEILRGTEAQMLAKNGDFLERLHEVVKETEIQMAVISQMTAAVKTEAEKNGYF